MAQFHANFVTFPPPKSINGIGLFLINIFELQAFIMQQQGVNEWHWHLCISPREEELFNGKN
jgi:hypothetical protein